MTPPFTTAELLRLLDNVPDPIARFDRELRHEYVNRATAIANNRPAPDFNAATMHELGHTPEVCEQIESNLNAVFGSGEARDRLLRSSRTAFL